jgi:hypothetical protein
MDGIGFALPGTPFDVVDLDHCFDPETGKADEWATTWLDMANGAYYRRPIPFGHRESSSTMASADRPLPLR